MRALLFLSFLSLLFSCQKESVITGPEARLSVSADSIKFDTIFTQTGSTSRIFLIRNENDEALILSTIKLMGGNTSPFRININGTNSNELNNIRMAAGDSLYVFVTAYIDPGNQALPFLVNDSILIAWNGNNRFVQLEAYGQHAHYIRNTVISTNEIWPNDLPYVILGGLSVDSGASLTIDAGCRIFLHADALMRIDGKLLVNGTASERVVFTGDRLDNYYRDLPGSWPGIFFSNSSEGNIISFASIRNAYRALIVSGINNTGPKLQLKNSIIDNAYDAGIYAAGAGISCENSLISNCGQNLTIILGGQYDFTHCSFASYSTQFQLHRFPVVYLSDAALSNGNIITGPLQSSFVNCIFWGDNGTVDDEILTDKTGNSFSVTLDHCLFKAAADPSNVNFISVIRNLDPLFDSIDPGNRYFDFHTNNFPGAPGIDQGKQTNLQNDLDGANRNVRAPDIGCYEKQ